MPVTDTQVKVLHDLLVGEPEAVSRAREEERAGSLGPLAALVEASLGIAVSRVSAPGWTMPGIIRFAARVRTGNAGSPLQFGATDAERELCRVLGDDVPPPRSYPAAGAAMMCMLETLIADLELDDAGLSGLLAQARTSADRILARAAPQPPQP